MSDKEELERAIFWIACLEEYVDATIKTTRSMDEQYLMANENYRSTYGVYRDNK